LADSVGKYRTDFRRFYIIIMADKKEKGLSRIYVFSETVLRSNGPAGAVIKRRSFDANA